MTMLSSKILCRISNTSAIRFTSLLPLSSKNIRFKGVLRSPKDNYHTSIIKNDNLLYTNIHSLSFSSSASKPSLPQLVKELRVITGAPMVECKKALTSDEVNLDLEKAIQWLRQHGSAKVSTKMKAGGRDAMEGLVGMKTTNEGASLVKIGSETDFASRSEVFATLVEDLASAALNSSVLTEKEHTNGFQVVNIDEKGEFWNIQTGDGSTRHMTVKQAMEEAILSIRENLQLKEVYCITAPSSSQAGNDSVCLMAGYVHGKTPHSNNAGTAAAVVELQTTSNQNNLSKDDIQEIGKKLAMHIVAAKPEYLSPEHVPADILEKEKEIISLKMGDTGKPPDIVEKIIIGKLRKFYEGICLTEQNHLVEDENPKISKFLKQNGLQIQKFHCVFI